VRVDVVDLLGVDPGVRERHLHRARRVLAGRVGLADVLGVGGDAVAEQLRVHLRLAPLRVCLDAEHDRPITAIAKGRRLDHALHDDQPRPHLPYPESNHLCVTVAGRGCPVGGRLATRGTITVPVAFRLICDNQGQRCPSGQINIPRRRGSRGGRARAAPIPGPLARGQRCYLRWKYSAVSSSTAGFDVCNCTSGGTSSSASE
jgi:hypothetical protein